MEGILWMEWNKMEMNGFMEGQVNNTNMARLYWMSQRRSGMWKAFPSFLLLFLPSGVNLLPIVQN